MAGIPSGGDSGSFDLGAFGMVGAGMSGLADRTQEAVQDFYKSQLGSPTSPWAQASDVLFAGLDSSLPFPIALIKEILNRLIFDPLKRLGIPGIDTIEGAFAALEEFGGWLWGLLEGFVGGAGTIIEQIVHAITNILHGDLSDLTDWFSDVGGFITMVIKKIVHAITGFLHIDLDSALAGLTAFFDDAGAFVFSVIKQIVHAITDVLHIDLDSALAGLTDFFSNTGDFLTMIVKDIVHAITGVFHLDLSAAWDGLTDFFGDVGGYFQRILNGVGEWFNNTFIKPIIGILTGNGINLDLGALGVWARGLLDQFSPLNATNLFGFISNTLFGSVPVGHISSTQPNLIDQGAFNVAESVELGSGWSWDGTENQSGVGGSLKVVADGTVKLMYSTQSIPVSAGDKIATYSWIKTTGYAGSGSPIVLSLIPFTGATQGSAVTLTSRGASTAWVQMNGTTYTVPAGVTSVRLRLSATNAMTAGSVNWDSIYLGKVGLLQQGLVDRLMDAWNNFWNGIFGGSATGKTVDDVLTAATSVSGTTNTNQLNHTNLISALLSVPGSVIGAITNVVIDGVSTFSQFLTGLWNSLTGGGTGTPKRGTDVNSAQSLVTSNANSGYANSNLTSGNLANTLNNLWDGFNGTSGSTGIIPSQVGTIAGTHRSNLYGVIDAAAIGLGGYSGTGYTASAVQGAADNTRQNISDMNQLISLLTTQAATGAYSGNAVSIDFATYGVSTAIGGAFASGQSYPFGTGSGYMGINSSGRAEWTVIGDSSKVCIARVSPGVTVNGAAVTGTKADMQRVGMVLSTLWGGVGGGGAVGSAPANYIFGRMNASSSQYVYARIIYANLGSGMVGGTTSGATIQFGYQGGLLGTTTTRILKAGATYWLECGTGTSGLPLRTFNLYENGTFIHQYIDSGSVTTTANYGVGFGMMGQSVARPCQVAAFSWYDNSPPAYKGSGFRASKLDTGTMSVTATTALLPGSYYSSSGTNFWKTSDLTYDHATNKLTVSKEGWYNVTIVQKATGSIPAFTGGTSGLALYKNGAVISRGSRMTYPASTTAVGTSMTCQLYLLPNDYIQPGYDSDWAHTLWAGEATGTHTYWQVNFINSVMPS